LQFYNKSSDFLPLISIEKMNFYKIKCKNKIFIKPDWRIRINLVIASTIYG